ncbi:MAG: Lipopolysaccharide export system protein LptC [Gammaproteobacteria bacterium]|nr:Lipopolysaccharide export system protein LptC [Gammaproteobacteria bacterium]
MKALEKIVYITVFACLGLLSVWLQFGIIDQPVQKFGDDERHDPDYYMENFTAIGMDKAGKRKYILEAERMVHYPDDDTALLDNPHIVQYKPGVAPRHTYSESGWMSSNGNELLLTGNVRVIQGKAPDNTGQNNSAGGVLTTEKLRVLLDRDTDSQG